MISIEEYKKNPCKALSIPYWKEKVTTVPTNMKIVHGGVFDPKTLETYNDRQFFRLKHDLERIPEFHVTGIQFGVIPPNRADELTDMMNRSYTHSDILISTEYIKSLTTTQVYCPELWIGADLEGNLVGSIVCDFDIEVGEAIIEWLQVLPRYRSRGIASALVCKALKTMHGFADFATVSGECGNGTNPERVYRKCGFAGDDVWHILNKTL